jgi:hypothetical protein
VDNCGDGQGSQGYRPHPKRACPFSRIHKLVLKRVRMPVVISYKIDL